MTSEQGFVLGDHQFLHPSQSGPISRFKAPKRQITGALPPTYLDGLVRESTQASPAATALFKGKFCGHDEPTMTIFDVVIDGVESLEVGAISDEEVEEFGGNLVLVAVRKPGGPWLALFRREWEEAQAGLAEFQSAKVDDAQAAEISEDILKGRVSIGFEYPCDAGSRDEISWLTIDVLLEGKKKPMCVVNAEMA